MLKRISGTFSKDDQSFLVTPSGSNSSPALLKRSPRSSPSFPSQPLPPVSPSSAYPFPYTPGPPSPAAVAASSARSLERPVLHSTLASLSVLLVALDELRETTTARAKAEKAVSKALEELGNGFEKKAAGEGGRSEVVVQALAGASAMMQTAAEVDAKYAKGVEKDYEGLNATVEKYFKKTAVRRLFIPSFIPFSPIAILKSPLSRL
jgi:hypothetical protein